MHSIHVRCQRPARPLAVWRRPLPRRHLPSGRRRISECLHLSRHQPRTLRRNHVPVQTETSQAQGFLGYTAVLVAVVPDAVADGNHFDNCSTGRGRRELDVDVSVCGGVAVVPAEVRIQRDHHGAAVLRATRRARLYLLQGRARRLAQRRTARRDGGIGPEKESKLWVYVRSSLDRL